MIPSARTSGARLGLVLAGLLCLAGPALAQEEFTVEADGRVLTAELAGHRVSFPGPLWTGPGESVAVEQSQFVYRPLEPGIESLLLLPPEENLVSWTRMMGVLAVSRPGYTAAVQIGSMVEPMSQNCTADNLVISRIPSLGAGTPDGLLMMCGRYNPTGSGPRGCAGGIIVAVALESELGAVKVYDEWCTTGFSVGDRASWPVSAEELQRNATELQQATRFAPLPG